MTYIIVGKSKVGQNITLQKNLKRFFKRDMESSPDIHILNPEEKSSIGIEEVKNFQKEMIYKPFEEKYQAGIILEAEKLTPEAQNALLKTLEDPSEYSLFFLCVDNEKNLLPTIISRGQVLYSPEEIEQQESNVKNIEDIFELDDIVEQFNLIEKYSTERELTLEFINSIENIFRSRLELDIKNGNIESSKKNKDSLNVIQESREKIFANCNRRLTLEAMFIRLNA